MNLSQVMDDLIAGAGLPPAARTKEFNGLGMDNRLLRGTLTDGREVLLRQGAVGPSPRPRALLLEHHEVGAPRLLAADDAGATLVEFIPGETLVTVAERGDLTEGVWESMGRAHARVHAVRFPAPLCGPVGPDTVELAPVDPVQSLLEVVDQAEDWVRRERASLAGQLDRLRERIDARAEELAAEVPCLTHLDTNFHNMIWTGEQVVLIDWDYPMVRYPLHELAGLEEHAYLYGVGELPDAFFAGYGVMVPRHLLRIHRIISCLGTLSSDGWAAMVRGEEDLPPPILAMVRRFYTGWSTWFDDLPAHLDAA